MADSLFLGQFHLGEGAVETIGDKERVVAEAHIANGFVIDLSAAFAFKNLRFAHGELAVGAGRNGLVRKCAEVTGGAVFDVFEFLHQLVVVRTVVSVVAAVAGAVDARFAVQREDFQPGIVGENGGFDAFFAEPFGHGARLDDGVFFKTVAVFDDVVGKADVLEGLEVVVFGAQDMGEVPDFTGIPGCDDE